MGCNTSKEAMEAVAQNAAADKKMDAPLEVEEAKASFEGAVTISEEVGQADAINASPNDAENIATRQGNPFENEVEKATEAIGTLMEPEVTDTNLKDPEANRAATKIQAAFRGHRTRKSMKKEEEVESKQNLQKEFSSENKELCEAATKIQASFRGHLVRKSASRKEEEEETLSKELEKLNAKARDEELDIDLNDPDLQMAATKIQASFRGHRVRKEHQPGSDE